MGFGENLQSIRKKNGLTQEALADMLGVSRQAVSRWEQGDGYPEVDKLLMLSEKLGVSIDSMMGLGSPESSPAAAEAVIDVQPSAKSSDAARIVCGVILTVLGFLFFFVPFIGYLQYVSLSIFLAGIACLAFRKHTVLAAVWGLFFGADIYLRLINGANWKTVFSSSAIKENMNPQVLSICWAFFIVGILLIVITALILAKAPGNPLPVRENGSVDIKRIVVFVFIIVIIWALFRVPLMRIFGITELAKDPEKYETLFTMIKIHNVTRGITDSAAEALIALQLGKLLSWIKQLIKRKSISG